MGNVMSTVTTVKTAHAGCKMIEMNVEQRSIKEPCTL